MCGILGHVAEDPGAVAAWSVDAAVAALRHRGPDGHGSFEDRGGGAACRLVHTRLAIIDLGDGGRQPMCSPDGRFALVFNGEIYNYRELRDELRGLGETFTSESDTEVLLQAFSRWGEGCVERLRGMFAFAIWDRRERTLTLARDRTGIKPLCLCRRPGGGLAFASEVRALLATGLAPRTLSRRGLEAFLAFGSVWGRQTLVEGVEVLPPATIAVWRAGVLTERRYWSLPAPSGARGGTLDEAIEALRPLLRESVRLQLRSDVKVGIFLSAGLDSSSLAALARQELAQPPMTLTVAFDDPRNEGDEAARIARHLGTEHREVHLSLDEALRSVPAAVAAMDQPSVDGVNTWFVSRAALQAGLKVALSGLGGDELFAGYASFRHFAHLLRAGRLLGPAGRAAAAAARLDAFGPMPNALRKALWMAEARGEPARAYAVLRALFTPEQAARLLPGHPGLSPFVEDAAVPGDPVNALSRFEIANYLRDTLLRDSDAMSMAHGLEVRPPFLDDRLIEQLDLVPGALKIAGARNKPLLAGAVGAHLPPESLARKKTGFELPFDAWLAGPLAGWIAEGHVAASRLGLALGGLHALAAARRRGPRYVQWHRWFAPAVLGHWATTQKMGL